jgi:type IV fimbrial biogenesis protein FimT
VLRSATRGFTLIELMIALAVAALLLSMGMPAFHIFLANTKVRGTADSLQSGLNLARSTAMRRNQNVDFVMTNDTIDLGSVGTVTPATNGKNWLVRVLDPSTGTYELLQSKSGAEGSGAVEGASPVIVNGSVAQVTFRGLGGTQGLASTATFDFSQPSAGACNTVSTPGPIRCLRVQVSVAGLIRICDPSTTAGDSRAC